jgi:hypothetical protein
MAFGLPPKKSASDAFFLQLLIPQHIMKMKGPKLTPLQTAQILEGPQAESQPTEFTHPSTVHFGGGILTPKDAGRLIEELDAARDCFRDLNNLILLILRPPFGLESKLPGDNLPFASTIEPKPQSGSEA